MNKRTVGILATSVAVSAFCVVTNVSAFAKGGGGGGFGGFTAGAVDLVDFTVAAVGLLGFTVVAAAGMAAGFMGLLRTVAWPTSGMGRVAMHGALTVFRRTPFTHTDLQVVTR